MNAIKSANTPSFAEKMFAVGALVSFSGALYRLGTPSATASPDMNNSLQGIWIAIYAVSGLFILLKTRNIAGVIGINKMLLLFIIYVSFSFLWSSAPLVSLKKIAGIIGPALFSYYLLCRFNQVDLLRLVSHALGLVAIGCLLAGVLYPQWGIMHQTSPELSGSWCGIFIHKNTLGQVMLAGAIVNLSLWKRTHNYLNLFFLLLSIILILLSRSSTCIIMVVIALAISGAQPFINLSTKAKIAFLLFFFFVTSLVIFSFNHYENLIQASFGKDLTFSGRSQIWDMVFPEIYAKPILGHGYGAFWFGNLEGAIKINAAMGVMIDTAHNGYLDILLDLGYIGLLLFFSFYLNFFFSYVKNFFLYKKKEYFFGFTFLFIQLIYNFFENSFIQPNHLYWILLIVTMISYKINTIELKITAKKSGSQSVVNGNILEYTK